MITKLKKIQSYEYAAESWKNFAVNRIVTFGTDIITSTFSFLIVMLAIRFLPTLIAMITK